jgi:hypothetical protein
MDQISPDALFFEPPMFVQTDTIVINPSPNLVTTCNKNNLQPAPRSGSSWELAWLHRLLMRRAV